MMTMKANTGTGLLKIMFWMDALQSIMPAIYLDKLKEAWEEVFLIDLRTNISLIEEDNALNSERAVFKNFNMYRWQLTTQSN